MERSVIFDVAAPGPRQNSTARYPGSRESRGGSRGDQGRAPFEKLRGVTSVTAQGAYAYLVAPVDPSSRAAQELNVYRLLSERDISINLVKLHKTGLSFVVNEAEIEAA